MRLSSAIRAMLISLTLTVGFANTFGQTETIGAYTSLSPADHRDPRRQVQPAHPVGAARGRPLRRASTGSGRQSVLLARNWLMK